MRKLAKWVFVGVAFGAAGQAGCGPAAPESSVPGESDGAEPESVGVGEELSGATVAKAVEATCSTTSVKGLSEQLVAQINCLVPGALAKVPARPNLSPGPAACMFLQPLANPASGIPCCVWFGCRAPNSTRFWTKDSPKPWRVS